MAEFTNEALVWASIRSFGKLA